MDADRLKALFAPFAAVAVRGMFGGRGVYAEGLMIALEANDEVYLKTDEAVRDRFVKAGSRPFIYPTPMGPRETSLWRLPAEARRDIAQLKAWALLALEAARRAAVAKEASGPGRAKNKAQKSKRPATTAKTGSPKRRATKTAKKRASSVKGRARRASR
ncbi:MAG TPA: TfoX/Sxy family protein [Roseiarcus sp.]|nr:TfoX/Sxy family protein [Roseiarcus sp.]